MKVSEAHIVDTVMEKQATKIKVYESHIRSLDRAMMFTSFEHDSTEEVIKWVKKFFETMEGRFTFLILTGKTSTNDNGCLMKTVVGEGGAGNQTHQPQVDIQGEIARQIESFKVQYTQEQQIIKLTEEVVKLKTDPDGAGINYKKEGFEIMKTLSGYIFSGGKAVPTVTPPIQGTPITAEQLQQACIELVKILGKETIVGLPAALSTTAGQGYIPMIKNFVNG